ncbi:MAG TPA: copper chaperone PCu(A)C [Gammaproteobacteria bacterium]|nr:copper chaperone PCu(A)C [Gammaproteobacteria bacterium]
MKTRRLSATVLLAAWVMLAGCSGGGGSTAKASEDVAVENAYARATPPDARVGAAFLTLKNAGGRGHALVAAASDVAATVELHEHVHKDGMMQMRQVPRIDIPAGGETRLQPGGYHIMLIDLKHPLAPGERASLTLTFEDGSKKQVVAPVRDIGLGMRRR